MEWSTKPTVIVILVPGILGSHLEKVWPANNKLELINLYYMPEAIAKRKLMLDASQESVKSSVSTGESYGVSEDQIKRGWLEIICDVYLPFLKHCQQQEDLPFKPIVYAVGYNFLGSNLKSCVAIITRTTEAVEENKDAIGFIYVTHSMGALATRAALKQMSPMPIYQKCIGVIHVAAPNKGSAETIMRFYRGIKGKLQPLLGDTGWKVTTLASALPTFFELLPDPKSIVSEASENTDKATDDPYHLKSIVEYHWPGDTQSENNPVNLKKADFKKSIDENLKVAEKFREEVGAYTFPQAAAVCLSLGKDVYSTPSKVTYKFDGNGKLLNIVSINDQGDGTVIVDSQKSIIKENLLVDDRVWKRKGVEKERKKSSYTVFDIEHAEPFKEKGKPQVWPMIYQYMNVFFYHYQISLVDVQVRAAEKALEDARAKVIIEYIHNSDITAYSRYLKCSQVYLRPIKNILSSDEPVFSSDFLREIAEGVKRYDKAKDNSQHDKALEDVVIALKKILELISKHQLYPVKVSKGPPTVKTEKEEEEIEKIFLSKA